MGTANYAQPVNTVQPSIPVNTAPSAQPTPAIVPIAQPVAPPAVPVSQPVAPPTAVPVNSALSAEVVKVNSLILSLND